MKQHPLPFDFSNPPQELRKAKMDNIALVPATLLPFKHQWQEIANSLPKDGILVCLSPTKGKMQETLQKVIVQLRTHGQQVTVVSSGQFR